MKITICMGSSCFSRGNGENLVIIESCIERHGASVEIDLRGCRCKGACAEGPCIEFGDELLTRATPDRVRLWLSTNLSPDKVGEESI